MKSTLRAFLLSFGDLLRPSIARIMVKSLAITIALVALLAVAAFAAIRWAMANPAAPWAGWEMPGALMGAIAVLAGGWFAWRGIAIVIVGLFADAIVAEVEARHYPAAAAIARPVGLADSLRLGGWSLLRFVGVNLIALPAYVVLLVTGVGTVALALLINAALLGRDLQAMVAARHRGAPPLARGDRWALGFVAAVLFLLPLANLLAPVLGAAMAVHMVHRPRPAA